MKQNLFFLSMTMLLTLLAGQSTAQSRELTTPRGFRYIAHTNVNGPKAQASDKITVHIGTYIGDSVMMNTRSAFPEGRSIDMPSQEQLNGPSIAALFEAALLMSVGDSSTIFMNIDSTIRRMLPPALQTYKEVRYEIVLLGIKPAAEIAKERNAALTRRTQVAKAASETCTAYKNGELAPRLKSTASGLKMLIEDKGSGAPIKKGEPVQVHYYGCLTDALMFDNSYQRGDPLAFNAGVGQMIPGFDEGVMLLNHGAKAYLFIPYPIGYGDQPAAGGLIPAKSELVFYIEIQ